MSLDFQSMFDSQAQSTRRAWAHDRSKTMGASEAFQCIRRTYFSKRGHKPDAGFTESYGATTRGNLIENHYVVPVVRAQIPPGADILWAGDDQITLVDGRLSATPDGLIKDLPRDALKKYGIDDIEADCILLEIKSFDPRLTLTEPKPVHAGQVQQQFGLVHKETNHRPEYAVILYVNASWLDDVRAFVIKRDPALYDVCKRRASQVFNATSPLDVPAEGRLKGGSECDYCPFVRQCSIAQSGRIPVKASSSSTLDKREDDEVMPLLLKSIATRRQIAALEEEKEATAEAIKEFLQKAGKRFLKTADGHTVTYKVMEGRKTYDTKKMAENAGVDLEEYAVVGAPSERLTIKGPKE